MTLIPQKTRELHSNHFDSTIWNDFEFRDDDIIISTYGKSGTTWMQQIIAQLLFLESEDPDKEVSVYINSPGGSVTAGLAIYDTMQYIKPDVGTICMGQCASMGALLLAAGTKGKRYALPHSRVMIHQPMGGAEGQATDIEIQAEEILRMKKQLNSILAKNSGQTLKKIEADTDRDNYLTSKEAKAYGLIDAILVKRK